MTPDKVDKDVQKLFRILNASHDYVYLDVEPEIDAEPNDCFPVVQKKVAKGGGRMILGWQIWKTKYLVEAECHAVWEDPDEVLRDITPKTNGCKQIMFVEDESLKYEGKQIRNFRINVSNNRLVDDWVYVLDAIHDFNNRGDRAFLYDLKDILNTEQMEHLVYLKNLEGIISTLLFKKGRRDSQCPCNSGLIFTKCHGVGMENRINKII